MNTDTPLPVIIPKHASGSHWDHLPRITERERLQKQTLHRFMSQQARYKLMKYSNLLNGPNFQQRRRRKASYGGGLLLNKVGGKDDEMTHQNELKKEETKNDDNVSDPPSSSSVQKNNATTAAATIEATKENQWVKNYDDRVTKLFQNPTATDDENNKPFDMLDVSHAVIKMQGSSCKEIFTPPIPWPAHLDRSRTCHVCRTICRSTTANETIPPVDDDDDETPSSSSSLTNCPYCSAVAHTHCLSSNNKKTNTAAASSSSSNSGDTTTTMTTTTATTTTCPECQYEVLTSHEHYLARKASAEEKAREQRCATKIAAKWRSKVAVRDRQKFKFNTLQIQSFLRCLWVEREFREMRRGRSRPLVLELVSARGLPRCDWENQKCDPYVIVTVLDKRDRQIWRYDGDPVYATVDPVFRQKYLIPGCPGTAKVVLTVLDRDELRDQFIGQAFLSLRRKDCCEQRQQQQQQQQQRRDDDDDGDGVMKTTLSSVRGSCADEVWCKGGYFRMALDELRYMPKTTSAADVAVDLGAVDFGTAVPQGDVEIKIRPMDGLRNMCGYLTSSPLEDAASSSSSCAFAADAAAAASGSSRSKKNLPMSMTKSRKYWCCIANHNLYFYSKFGSSQPKLVLDLNDFTVQFMPNQQIRLISTSAANNKGGGGGGTGKRKGKEYKLLCLKANDRDRWRTAFEVSYDRAQHDKEEGGDWNKRIAELTKKMSRRVIGLESSQIIKKRQQHRRESVRATMLMEKKRSSSIEKKTENE